MINKMMPIFKVRLVLILFLTLVKKKINKITKLYILKTEYACFVRVFFTLLKQKKLSFIQNVMRKVGYQA